MALTTPAPTANRNPKAINIGVDSGAAGLTVYTVPEGRMFTGTINASNAQNYPFRINGRGLYAATYNMPNTNNFEIGPGCTISTESTSTTGVIAGIERDLV